MAIQVVAARPLSIGFSTPAITAVLGIKSIGLIDDPELHEELDTNEQYPSMWTLQLRKGFTFVSTDMSVRALLPQGTYFATCTMKMESGRTGDNTKQISAHVVQVVYSCGIITKVEELEVTSEGKPAAIRYTVMACKAEDGTLPTVTETIVTS